MASQGIREKLRISPVAKKRKLAITTPRLVNTQLIGSFRSMVKGRGIEFEGYRTYVPGYDDSSKIDWKASSRSDKSMVKEFKEERDINIMFLLNGGSCMAFSSTDKLKLEYAIEVISLLAYNAIASGDRVGLAIYGAGLKKFILPSTGKRQYYNIMTSLEDTKNYGGPSDITASLKYVTKRLPRNSLLFIVSDFINVSDNLTGALRLASLKLDTIGIMVRDPRDEKLPDHDVGQVVIKDPMSGETLMFDPHSLRETYARLAAEQVDSVRLIFHRSKANLVKMSTDEPSFPKLMQFFHNRITAWK
jgi:uncharacterized protein (DUF58 family)